MTGPWFLQIAADCGNFSFQHALTVPAPLTGKIP